MFSRQAEVRLIASCRLAEIDPADYLTDVLERISVHPAFKVQELIPVNWKRLRADEIQAAAPLLQAA